jgi:ATP synthase protein I
MVPAPLGDRVVGTRKEACLDDRDPPGAASNLQARIDEARRKAAPPPQKPGSPKALAVRAGIELFAGVAFGLIAGIALDRWLGTAPWLMVVLMVLGIAAALRNVLRAAEEENRKARKQDADTGP